MKRKRTNLDTSEANYIYAHVLLELNKHDEFNKLFITERNKLIDEICLEVIENANKNEDDKEALKFEILAYKLSEEERKKSLLPSVYKNDLEKPEDFNEQMKEKYDKMIKHIVRERLNSKFTTKS